MPVVRRRPSDDDQPWRAFTVGKGSANHRKKKKHRGSDKKVHGLTGYHPPELDEVWNQLTHDTSSGKPVDHLKDLRKKTGHDDMRSLVFLVYSKLHVLHVTNMLLTIHVTNEAVFCVVYIHLAPTMAAISIMWTPTTGDVSETFYRTRIKPVMLRMSEQIDLIRFEDRLLPNNHCFHFPKWITGIIDCAPIRIRTPGRSQASKRVFQSKTSQYSLY